MPTLKYNKFKYIIENPLDFTNGMRIEYEGKIPANLYKYYSPQGHNLESITKGELYFSHPYRFNDIKDTNPLSFDFSSLKFKNYCLLFEESNLSQEELKTQYEEERLNGFQSYRILLYSLWTQKIGICCLSNNEMHDLMWGHYASDSGFKIKYDSDKLIKSLNKNNENPCKIFPINYTVKKLQVNVPKYGIGLSLLLDFSTKVESWNYENEWRIVMTKNDMDVPNQIKTPNIPNHEGRDSRLFKLDSSCISEIVFGMNFFNGSNLESSKYISENERIIKTKDVTVSAFLTYIVENLSDKIHQAGIFVDSEQMYDGAHPIGRSIEQIHIEKIDSQRFVLKRNNPETIKMF